MINIINPRIMLHYQEGIKRVNETVQKIENIDLYMDALEDLVFKGLDQTKKTIETRLNQIDPARVDQIQYSSGIIGVIKRLFDQCKKAILTRLFPEEMKDLQKTLEEIDQATKALEEYKGKMVEVLKKEQEELFSIDESKQTSVANGLLSRTASLVYSLAAYTGSFFGGESSSSIAVEEEISSKPIANSEGSALVDQKNNDKSDDLQINLQLVKKLFKNVAYEGLDDQSASLFKVQEKIFECIFASDKIESIVYNKDGTFKLDYKGETKVDFSTWLLKITAILPKSIVIAFEGGKITFLGDNLPVVTTRLGAYTFSKIGFESGQGSSKMLVGKGDSSIAIDESKILDKLENVFGKKEIGQILAS